MVGWAGILIKNNRKVESCAIEERKDIDIIVLDLSYSCL